MQMFAYLHISHGIVLPTVYMGDKMYFVKTCDKEGVKP